MNSARPRPADNSHDSTPLADDAVVVGGSLAGLAAASVLAHYFRRVTILERDALSGPTDFRPGVPQARHAHTLLPEGQAALEQLFPGLLDELIRAGAVPVDPAREILLFMDGVWRAPKNRETGRRVTFSRPLIESLLRARLAARPNVIFLASQEVVGLRTDAGRVSGVRLRRRGALRDGVEEFPAQLVVDASGRTSQAPRWLTDLGYLPPREAVSMSRVSYATRLYQPPAGFDEGWKIMYIRPRPPADTLAPAAAEAVTRGGLILPIEGGRWLVTVIGAAGDYPPTDPAGFEAFARGLSAPRFFETMRRAEPVDEPFGFQMTESRLRRYDRLPAYLEGLLVCGDAVMTLNPVYALGMTAAATGGLVLNECLRERSLSAAASGLAGLAQAFHARLAAATLHWWEKVSAEDARWPMAEMVEDAMPLALALPKAPAAFELAMMG